MTKLFLKIRRVYLVHLLGFFKLSAVAFTFQCCYGTPQDFEMDVRVNGVVTSSESGLPIEGISVEIDNKYDAVQTNANGFYSFYTLPDSVYTLKFSDVDGNTNGAFWDKYITIQYDVANPNLTVDMALNPRDN